MISPVPTYAELDIGFPSDQSSRLLRVGRVPRHVFPEQFHVLLVVQLREIGPIPSGLPGLSHAVLPHGLVLLLLV
jgi:hypothetical protein